MTAAERLCELIRIPTISSLDPSDEDPEVFRTFPDRLAALYPRAHAAMAREPAGERGIIYRWDGEDPSLEPVLGLAHYDVVPPGDPESWERDPFSGTIEDGRIHGRGSLDDKGMLAAWMEAVDRLAASGFRPQRSLFLAFGGDEETTGFRGAGHMASLFARWGLRFAFILDEGGAVAVDQLSAFTDAPVALVGIAEKGYLTLRITAEGMSGHASAPPKRSAIGRLGSALARLEATPAAPRLTIAPIGMLQALGRAGGSPISPVLRHPRLFGGILKRVLAADPATAALVRSTLAPTVLRGGERDNVLPEKVEAAVNLRLLPGDSVAKATARVAAIVNRAVDAGVSVECVEGSAFEPVPAAGHSGRWWDMIGTIAGKYYPGVVPAPYLMTGTTDSRWYRALSENIYRFFPMKVDRQEMSRVHAANESISLESWNRSVDFMGDLLVEALGRVDTGDAKDGQNEQ